MKFKFPASSKSQNLDEKNSTGKKSTKKRKLQSMQTEEKNIKSKEEKVDADFFELIDSMYKERSEE